MPRRTLMLSLLLVTFATAVHSQSQAPLDAARRADAYAVYSQLIKDLTNDGSYLIQDTTVSASMGFGDPMRPTSAPGLDGAPASPNLARIQCPVQPPADGATTFQEILADYAQRKDTPALLAREFTLDKPYELVNAETAKKFLQDALAASPQFGPAVPNSNPLAQKAGRLIRLGNVYFDKQGNLAVTYVSVLTTTVDATGEWRVFRKVSPGNWLLDRSWRTCGWGSAR